MNTVIYCNWISKLFGEQMVGPSYSFSPRFTQSIPVLSTWLPPPQKDHWSFPQRPPLANRPTSPETALALMASGTWKHGENTYIVVHRMKKQVSILNGIWNMVWLGMVSHVFPMSSINQTSLINLWDNPQLITAIHPCALESSWTSKKMATESKDVEVNVGKTMPFLPAIWEW